MRVLLFSRCREEVATFVPEKRVMSLRGERVSLAGGGCRARVLLAGRRVPPARGKASYEGTLGRG
uniref:Uncharacterized protein n=1 Tax=Oryza punctata TaxID=4537 RepID=A0A0E0L6H4_ORYPU